MLGILLRASVVAGILAIVIGLYLMRDASQTMRIGAVSVAEEQARQDACRGDPVCVVNHPSGFAFIDDLAAGIDAQEQWQRGRIVLYTGLGLISVVFSFFLLRWIMTGRVRTPTARGPD